MTFRNFNAAIPYFCKTIQSIVDFFPSTFLQPVNGCKNSILNLVIKLYFHVFFLFCFWNTLERFSILFTYSSYFLVYILTNTHKESCVYLSSQLFFDTPHKTLNLKKKQQEKYIFQQSSDLNFKSFSFGVYYGATPPRHWTKQTINKLNLCGKRAVNKSAWIKSLYWESKHTQLVPALLHISPMTVPAFLHKGQPISLHYPTAGIEYWLVMLIISYIISWLPFTMFLKLILGSLDSKKKKRKSTFYSNTDS